MFTKNPEQNGRWKKNQNHDETVNNCAEDNCLLIPGICFFLDSVRYIHDLGVYDK